MTKATKNGILGAAAKALAWELFSDAGYCRTRAFVNVERFDREMRSAARQWSRTHHNLKGQRRKHGRSES